MKIISSLLLASTLALFAMPAVAQESNTLGERNIYVFMNGKMHRMTVNDAQHAMIMQKFKPMKQGMMIYYSGGAFFVAEDEMMPNGKMMSAEFFGRDLGSGSQR
jgi:hypothetical protein